VDTKERLGTERVSRVRNYSLHSYSLGWAWQGKAWQGEAREFACSLKKHVNLSNIAERKVKK